MNALEEVALYCPYCAEPISVLIDCSGGDQRYIEDCSVCCRPMVVVLRLTAENFSVSLHQENDAD